MTFNTDGCQLSRSSSASGWPIYVQINELPPHWKKYVFLAGIFVDTRHPLMNNYLIPFIDQMKELFQEGICWRPSESEEVTTKFIVTTCSVDSPARALVTRMNQFNGYFGCTFCYAKGERHGHKHIYPLDHCFKRHRVRDELLQDMKTAFTTKLKINGVKGISSLITLPKFNICKGIVVEAMHAAFLGAVKQHTELLITSTRAMFYIGAPSILQRIDQRLLSIRPPTRRSRIPRSLTTYKQWKASEWRNWLDYAPVCLENILNLKYVEHLALLSQALHYFNNDSVSNHELDKAENLIIKYVTLFQDYFGKENMSFNIHLLTHLTNTVRSWGPIWAHNAFSFESWNKRIVDKVTSAHARVDQIVTKYLMAKFIELSIYNTTVAEETKTFICRTLKIFEHNNLTEIFINLGSSEERLLTEDERNSLREIDIDLPESLVISYARVKFNKVEYRREENTEAKFCNAYIYCKTYGFAKIQSIIQFTSSDGEVIRGFFINCFKIIKKMFNTDYIVKIEEIENIKFVDIKEDLKPAVKILTANGTYALKLANCWETD